MRRAAMTVMVFLLLALAAVGAAAEEDAGEPAPAKRGGPNPPTFEQTYAGYAPKFIREYRGKPGGDARKFSRQKDYVNMADVRTDSEVRPTIKKANELVAAGEHRKATTWYRKILKEFPDDLIQIAERGIFIPASLYVQRKILAYPKKELDYYRVLYDPAARAIYEKAVRRYSLFDYKELADYHLATSYGDDTLFALGNDAVDKGQYKEARRCYERIVTYHGLTDEDRDKIELDRDRVWVRLAICYKHLGQREEYRAAAARIADRTDEAVARLLEQLEKLRYDEFAVHQREGRRSARYDALDDRSLSGPMPYDFSANRGKWTAPLPSRSFLEEPEALPWATETDLIYKDRNVLYSRSLLTGELNWVFGPGGTARPWDRCRRGWDMADFAPNQSILVQDGVVCTNMFVYGPSLVAVDQYTGMLLWAKGPIAAQTEKEGLERYQACPAAGRGMVVAPVVFDDIRGRSHLSSSADLAAFETRTGKLLWRTTLARIAPLKITQSRYPRKIRILSSTPLLKEGVVYHVTNAGVVAAVDACTGRVRWITRYPQSRRVLDNLSHPGVLWSNEAPMIRGGRLYVTPLDCQFLLCLDTETGRILWEATRNSDSRWVERSRRQYSSTCWRMAGITSDDLLCVAGRDLAFLDPKTGRLAWHWRVAAGNGWGRVFDKPRNLPKGLELAIDGEGNDYWCHLGHMNARPTLTLDGKVYFANKTLIPHWPGHPFNSEYCLDLEKRGLTLQRRWFSPQAFVLDHQRIQPLT
ncbi:MAG: PQQ-binding-like beta-propeller repeat protein, partial [Planctomycetota bacterium]